ncbi:cell division protein FtsQ/DivIB [Kordiimonas sp. SCSIO 12610]|uniref:cell division protein FtsQ/DivIB n=1 Tax=Kordiimonas sp. SCSIO 12610 TaxID=2829597 RepID=UPI00210E61CF|nr:FtsQ-type POTRA domain-containing protein [Kordiimonas sp. SCSIO 12610]UTW56413.1 FtsQ-type POTRA domain-containing protein [Kordiimonas sp. SCSIO 12610]
MTAVLLKHRKAVGTGFMALLSSLMLILFLIGKLEVGAWFMNTTRDAGFVLNDLKVEGQFRTSDNAILAQLDIEDGMPLFAINLGQIKDRLIALPWVKDAQVVRKFPTGLEIKITEREPYGLWQHKGEVYIIDITGTVVKGQDVSNYAYLPWVVGDGAAANARALFDMLNLAPELFANVKQAVRVGDRRWDIIFNNGIRVKLPETALNPETEYGAEASWLRFAKIQNEHKLLSRELNVIDMRISDRVIMRITPEGERAIEGKEWAA